MPSEDGIILKPMSKTDQTFEALKKLARLNPYSKIPLKMIVHKGEFTGFTQNGLIEIEFRAQDEKKRLEAAK